MEPIEVIAYVASPIIIALLGVIIWFGRDKFTNLTKTDERLEKKLDKVGDEINNGFFNIEKRIGRLEMEKGLAGVAGSSSPISLNDKGIRILRESGIKEWLGKSDVKAKYLEQLKLKSPTTAYDVQECVFKIIDEATLPPDLIEKLKETAFKEGEKFAVVLRVGAIYFRDIVLKELDMNIEDVDKKSEKV